LTICDRISLGDNLTIEVGEKGAEGTLNGELLFQNRTSRLSREARICSVTPRYCGTGLLSEQAMKTLHVEDGEAVESEGVE